MTPSEHETLTIIADRMQMARESLALGTSPIIVEARMQALEIFLNTLLKRTASQVIEHD